MNNNNIFKHISLNLVYRITSILLSLLSFPILISYLGDTLYGIWATILQIVSWVNFFDIGIGNGLRNNLTISLTKKNYEEAKKYITTAYIIVITISFKIFIILFLGLRFLNWQSIFNTVELKNSELNILIIITVMFVCVMFVTSLIKQVIFAMQSSSNVGLIQIIGQILNLTGLFLLNYFFDKNLMKVVIVYGISGILANLIFTGIFFKKYTFLRPNIKYFSKKIIKELTSTGIKFFIIQIAAMIIFTTDNLIITKLYGPQEVTPYSLTFKMFSLIIMFHNIIITPLWSAYTKAYVEGNIKWLRNTLLKLNYLQIVIIVISLIVSFVFRDLMWIWLRKKFDISNLLILYFLLYTILSTWSNTYSYILSGLNKIEFQLYLAIFQGAINIPLSIYFAINCNLGSAGVILGTVITLLPGAIILPINVYYLLNKIKENKSE